MKWTLPIWLCLAPCLMLAESNDSLKNAVRVQFGPSFTGWDLQARYARTFGQHELGAGYRLVLEGNLHGDDASSGAALFYNYIVLAHPKARATIGPSINYVCLNLDDSTERHYYYEGFINLGLQFTVLRNMELGCQIGYGGVYAILSNKFSDDRPTEAKQASSMNINLGYRF